MNVNDVQQRSMLKQADIENAVTGRRECPAQLLGPRSSDHLRASRV